MDAFKRDDGARAWSFASPEIRKIYPSPEEFMEMVRSFYRAVYRPENVVFQKPVRQGAQIVQPVRLTDAEGRSWISYYPVIKLPDGSWRINGCQLTRLQGQET